MKMVNTWSPASNAGVTNNDLMMGETKDVAGTPHVQVNHAHFESLNHIVIYCAS